MVEENFINSLNGFPSVELGLFLADNQYVDITLVSVEQDFLIGKVKDDVFYFPFAQIKAMTKNLKEKQKHLNNLSAINSQEEKVTLEEALKNQKYMWITINTFNNQSFSGILNDVTEDYLLLTNGEKQYFIKSDLLLNIYIGEFKEEEEQDLDDESTEESSENHEPLLEDEPEENNEPESENDEIESDDEEGDSELALEEDDSNDEVESTEEPNNLTSIINKLLPQLPHHPKPELESSSSSGQDNENSPQANMIPFKFNSPMNAFGGKILRHPRPPHHENKEVEETHEEAPVVNEVKPEPEPVMSHKERHQLVESQYYSLMKYAEKMNELQYQYKTLMKHAGDRKSVV